MIKVYTLKDFKVHPKPRGQLGKSGNMTHSSGNYRDWQNECVVRLRSANFQLPSRFYGLVYFFYWSKFNRGRLPDGGNLRGGMEDAMVSGQFIQDDNVGILPINMDVTFVRYHTNAVQILIPESIEDFIHIFKHETKFQEMLDS